MPVAASASMFGVRQNLLPLQPSESQRCWSVVMKRSLRPMCLSLSGVRGSGRPRGSDRDAPARRRRVSCRPRRGLQETRRRRAGASRSDPRGRPLPRTPERLRHMGRKLLFITTDQQRWDSLGCNGNRFCRTPNIDALAATGINYARAYNQNTVCMPARSTMLTGQYVRTHGVFANGVPLPEDAPSFAQYLKDKAG